MTKNELRDFLLDNHITDGKKLNKKAYHHLRDILKKHTSILDDIYGGKVSTGMRLSMIIDEMVEPPKCHQCDNYVGINSSKFGKTCSRACNIKAAHKATKALPPEHWEARNKKTQETLYQKAVDMGLANPETYTSTSMFPETIKKSRETMKRNWVGGHNMRDPSFYEKWKSEFEEKYGVSHPMQVPEINEKVNKTVDGEWIVCTDSFKEKSKNTCVERYGVEHPMYSEEIKQEMRRRSIIKYGREYPQQSHISDESLAILNDKTKLESLVKDSFLEDVGVSLGVHKSSVQRACANFNIPLRKSRSRAELELEQMITGLGFSVIANERHFGHELDLYIPEKNVAIEFNGMYWHSELYKSRSYHQRKSIDCMRNDVLLIHIWEDDWEDPMKKPIIISKIKSKLGVSDQKVYARKTQARVLSKEEAIPFLERNHIQGKLHSSIHIGLIYGEDIVAVMSMKRLGNGCWDLSRFATSCSVVGGMSKCLSFFKKNYEWSGIITFASLDYSHGTSYEMCGFDKVSITPPNMWYMKQGEWIRLGRRRFTKAKLPNILPSFDPSLSESDNMRENGYLQIFDSGSIKYIMTK